MDAKRIILFFMLISFFRASAQYNDNGNGNGNHNRRFLHVTRLYGDISLSASYRDEKRMLLTFNDHSNQLFLVGGLNVNMNSYIWHPNFLKLDVGFKFNPATHRENYIVIPDRSEVATANKIDLKATLFSQRPLNLSLHGGFDNSYISREYITSVNRSTYYGGANLNFNNKFLPASAMYDFRNSRLTELDTDRKYENSTEIFQVHASKSFTKNDRTDFNFSKTKYYQKNWEKVNFRNSSDNLQVNNSIYFDNARKYQLRSSFSNITHQGDLNISRLLTREETSLKLPAQLSFFGDYIYSNTEQENQFYKQHNVRARLEHQLYLSLHTGLSFQYTKSNQSYKNETVTAGGLLARYNKKIPTGTLSLSYSYRRQHNDGKNKMGPVQILNEEHLLSDGSIIFLDKPYVEVSSVVVKDITGVIIYQIDFDYQLIQRGNLVEIRRIPGGQILNNTSILIDYISIQPGDFTYDGNHHNFSASVVLLDRRLELYYSWSKQDFMDVQLTDYLTLDSYDRHIMGTRVTIAFLSAGVEYEIFNSTLVPIRRSRYYININRRLSQRISINLNGDLSDYHFTDIGTQQLFLSSTGALGYQINTRSKLSFEGGFRRQKGEAIDLNLYSARLDYSVNYRLFTFITGAEFYKREYVGTQTNFWGVYLKAIRSFQMGKR